MEMKTAADIMSKNLITASKDQTLKDAIDIMKAKKVDHLPIVSLDGTLLGIISDRDVKKFTSPFIGSGRETAQDLATLQIRLEKVMKTELVTATLDESVKDCIGKILDKQIHAVPVVESTTKHLQGMITTTNILKWVHTEVLV